MKLWQKKYNLNKKIEAFTVGTDYLLDQKLVKYDCRASIAHAKMLEKIGILTRAESENLIRVLGDIMELDGKGEFRIRKEDEDCHTAIENYLTKKLGNTGKKIHTARSRNDQVLTALRLYYRDEIEFMSKQIDNIVKTLWIFKKRHAHVEIPGYTHMRKAMPSSFGVWATSFEDSMLDNKALLLSVGRLVDQSPLGTGAGYGVPIKVDRRLTAELLGFRRIQKNPLYVQNSRGKFESSLLHAMSQIMYDLNRMSSDILLFSMPDIGYLELPQELCTGSSMMPHKKNPDVLELVRASYHTIVSLEFEVKTMTGNLISGYSRDVQLTKEPVMRGFEITDECLSTMNLVLEKIKVNEKKCKKAMVEELYATQKAYELVGKGIPFRDAYKKISRKFEK